MTEEAATNCLARNPFVGPRPFRPGEQLHGRDRDARTLANTLISGRVVLLHAPSGAGKTSIIQAVLLDELERRKFEILGCPPPEFSALRVNEPPPAFAVANRYAFSIALGLLAKGDVDPASLAGLTVSDAVQRAGDHAGGPSRQIVIIDQLEEVLTLDPTDQPGQENFFRQLGVALDEHPRLWALLCMREDYMGGLDRFVQHIPGRLRATYRLDFLDRDSAARAIRLPIERADATIDDDALERLLDNLVTQDIDTPTGMETRTGWYAEPLHLQVACEQLWRRTCKHEDGQLGRITLGHVKAFGEVDAALERYYDDCVEAAAQRDKWAERAIRDWIGDELVTAEGFRNQKPAASAPFDDTAMGILQARYLIRSETKGPRTWWELSHDQLTEPIRRSNARWRRRTLDDWQRRAALWERSGSSGSDPTLLSSDDIRRAKKELTRLGDRATEVEKRFVAASDDRIAELSYRQWVSQSFSRLTVGLMVSVFLNIVFVVLFVVSRLGN
jgi:Novel STAND NTPase 1